MFTKKSCSVHRISPMYQFLSKLPYFSTQSCFFFFFLIDICIECDHLNASIIGLLVPFVYSYHLIVTGFHTVMLALLLDPPHFKDQQKDLYLYFSGI